METDLGESRYEMEDRCNNNNHNKNNNNNPNQSKKLTSKRSHLRLAQSTALQHNSLKTMPRVRAGYYLGCRAGGGI
jgi:hypothetical protein